LTPQPNFASRFSPKASRLPLLAVVVPRSTPIEKLGNPVLPTAFFFFQSLTFAGRGACPCSVLFRYTFSPHPTPIHTDLQFNFSILSCSATVPHAIRHTLSPDAVVRSLAPFFFLAVPFSSFGARNRYIVQSTRFPSYSLNACTSHEIKNLYQHPCNPLVCTLSSTLCLESPGIDCPTKGDRCPSFSCSCVISPDIYSSAPP